MKITNLCRVGEDYYIAAPTFEWFPGVEIYHSRDQKKWRLVSRPLNRINQLDMKGYPDGGGVWEPHLSHHAGRFWLVYSDVKVVGGAFRDGANCLTTCATIGGVWSDPIYLNSSGFGASMLHDGDGLQYLANTIWDFREKSRGSCGIAQQQYSHYRDRLVGLPEIIVQSSELEPYLCIKAEDYPEMDDFDADMLSIRFQTLRKPLGESIASLTERPGCLRLHGQESLTSPFTQAHVAQRWQSRNFDAATSVAFLPKTFQQMAGLTNYFNTANWTALYVTCHEEKGKVLDIMTAENNVFANPLHESGGQIVIPKDVEFVHLKAEARNGKYTYNYSFDGGNWIKIDLEFSIGTYTGMFCTDGTGTDGMGKKAHADFDYFLYKKMPINVYVA